MKKFPNEVPKKTKFEKIGQSICLFIVAFCIGFIIKTTNTEGCKLSLTNDSKNTIEYLKSLPDSSFICMKTFGADGFQGCNGCSIYIYDDLKNEVSVYEVYGKGLKYLANNEKLGKLSLEFISSSYYVNPKFGYFEDSNLVISVDGEIIDSTTIPKLNLRLIQHIFKPNDTDLTDAITITP